MRNLAMIMRKLENEDGTKVFDGGSSAKIKLLNMVPDHILGDLHQAMDKPAKPSRKEYDELVKPSAPTQGPIPPNSNNGTASRLSSVDPCTSSEPPYPSQNIPHGALSSKPAPPSSP